MRVAPQIPVVKGETDRDHTRHKLGPSRIEWTNSCSFQWKFFDSIPDDSQLMQWSVCKGLDSGNSSFLNI